jgi:xanthosine utilization system XapX-like protein
MSHPTSTTSARHTTAAPSTPDQPPSWAPAAPTVALLTALGVLMVGQMYTVLALLHPMATALGTTPSTPRPRTPAARPSPSTDAACSSAPAWAHSSPEL